MKIYTRTGDQGTTGLFGGERVSKRHPRLAAYGTLDELNSVLGVLALHLDPALAAHVPLGLVQRDLFALGAVLATPPARAGQVAQRLTHPLWPVAAMEADIDRLTALAGPMTHFVLPGGCPGSAYGHWARTVCRRAEREVVALQETEPVPPEVVVYLNRLSDWLFALARAANAQAGVEDVKWEP
ncbi:MAG: cob(I)yrinic acid a,c-diamide adenosyltransferase [Holophaga sp.]|jgi:cob(I)alamin adenosyltransferase